MLIFLGASFFGSFLPDWLELLLFLLLWLIALILYVGTYIVACLRGRELVAKSTFALLWPIAAGMLGIYISAFHGYGALAASNDYFRAVGVPLLIILQFFLLVRRGASPSSDVETPATSVEPSGFALMTRVAAVAGGCVLFPLFFLSNCVVLTVDWQHDPPADMLAKRTASRINRTLAESEKWVVDVLKIEFGRKPSNYRREILYNVAHGRAQVIYNHSTVYARGRRGTETRYWRLDISADGLVPHFRSAETEQALAGPWLESEYDPSQVSMY